MNTRTVGLCLIIVACVLSFALGLKAAHGGEPERIEDLQPPAMAMEVERDGDTLVAIRVYDAEGKIVAVLRADGTVETDKEPETAARAFWYALSGYVKQCSNL
jgi:hypothetical protein